MTLMEGRPKTDEGRLAKEIRAYDVLDSLGISYQRIDHDVAMTMEACAEIDAVLGATVCKNLFLCNRQKTEFFLLMMPGDKPFKTKDLSAQISSSRLSFASAEDMETYLDITPGSVSVMGLIHDKSNAVRLLIDEEILEGDLVGCHPCVNTSSIRISRTDLLDVFLPAVNHGYTVVRLPKNTETV